MLKSKSFVKVTKKGALVNIVKEHYLRDDITCGIYQCPLCSHISTTYRLLLNPMNNGIEPYSFPHYIIPDTNIILHQLDILDHEWFKHVIVLQTVLEEVKHINIGLYERLKLKTQERSFHHGYHYYIFHNEYHKETYLEQESNSNDRNDKAIRMSAYWYSQHIYNAFHNKIPYDMLPRIILLTDDVANRQHFLKEIESRSFNDLVHVYSMREYLENISKTYLELKDRLAIVPNVQDTTLNYAEYLPLTQLKDGIQRQIFYSGTLNISTHNTNEGSIVALVKEQPLHHGLETIYIRGQDHLNRSVHEDTIVVQLLPKNEWICDSIIPKITGKVVGILQRTQRYHCGSIDINSKIVNDDDIEWINFQPLDTRIPNIFIHSHNMKELVGQRLVVCLDEWSLNHPNPFGHLVKKLGLIGQRNIETEAILIEYGIPYEPFVESVLSCLPAPDWKVDSNDRNRVDLRYSLNGILCSIDPPGCTDIDDALHARLLSNDTIEVGVHIADVSHFVLPNTALDIEAAYRSTTVYLVNRRIDMLPELLGTNLCSLKQDVDRNAFSCIWIMDMKGNILSTKFTKSIIKSSASLTYETAQSKLDKYYDHINDISDPLVKSICLLNRIAKKLREKRLEHGALTLASPEVRFSMEQDDQSLDVEMKEMNDANILVEEFMLLANISVAKQIYQSFPQLAVLRRHPHPSSRQFDDLKQMLLTRGFNLNADSSLLLSRSLDLIVDPNDEYFNKLIRIMTTRCMMQAVYFCSGSLSSFQDYWHYGLATSMYTHFTSPIRRYADIIVHRMLFASITDNIWSDRNKAAIESLCSNMNYRHRMAQYASRNCIELFTFYYFKDKTIEKDAYITKILKNGLILFIPEYGIEGCIAFNHKISDIAKFDSINLKFISNDDNELFKIFDKIKVKIGLQKRDSSGQYSKQKLYFEWINIPSELRSFVIEEQIDIQTTISNELNTIKRHKK